MLKFEAPTHEDRSELFLVTIYYFEAFCINFKYVFLLTYTHNCRYMTILNVVVEYSHCFSVVFIDIVLFTFHLNNIPNYKNWSIIYVYQSRKLLYYIN